MTDRRGSHWSYVLTVGTGSMLSFVVGVVVAAILCQSEGGTCGLEGLPLLAAAVSLSLAIGIPTSVYVARRFELRGSPHARVILAAVTGFLLAAPVGSVVAAEIRERVRGTEPFPDRADVLSMLGGALIGGTGGAAGMRAVKLRAIRREERPER